MKKILILRHAKAEPAADGKRDFQRPLTDKGREDARAVARNLAKLDLVPDLVLASAAPRAAQTADGAVQALPRQGGQGGQGGRVPVEKVKSLYAASPEQWMERIRKVPPQTETLLVVGHNPELDDLVLALANRPVHLRKAALAVLQFKEEWKNLGPASAKLLRILPPPADPESAAASDPASAAAASGPAKPHARWTDRQVPSIPPQNRELSWLSFNERVLQEASDPDVPPLDQLMFLGIVSANLDEFFRVRVGAMEGVLRRVGRKKNAAEARQIFVAVDLRAANLQRQLETRVGLVCKALAKRGVRLVSEPDFTAEERQFCRRHCDEKVRSAMTVLTNLKHSALRRAILTDNVYLAVTMTSDKGKVENALIRPPADRVGRFVKLPQKTGRHGIRIAWLDDVIRAALPDIFGHFGFHHFEAHTVKLTRSAEMEVDDEFSPRFAERFAGAVKGRDKGAFVRLIYDRDIPGRTLKKMVTRLRLDKHCLLVPAGRYHNLRDFREFPRPANRPALARSRPATIPHPVLNRAVSLLDSCAAADQLIHLPYHDFSLVLKLLREASMDPDVSAIQMTAYRLAAKSRVVGALINALRNGKKVFCVVEPRARFDEEANLRWARILEESGASVSHGLAGHKTHAKAILISRAAKRGRPRDVAVLGTGNFNEDSARVYSDLALATANPEMVRDVAMFFRLVRDPAHAREFKRLLVSPRDMRDSLAGLIRREAENAAAGKPCGVWLKLNNISDPPLMRELEKAAAAGVPVRLAIRGVLGMDPEKPALEGNVRAVSIIDSLLEHARILIFENAGKPRVYIGSADWMRRNMERRLEIYAPVLDRKLAAELHGIMEIQFADNVKARILNGAQDNRRAGPAAGEKARRAQSETREFYRRAWSAAAED